MTLAEKIKRYRLLAGMSQKELGLSMGFTSCTAASRINQYEQGNMKPKEHLRKKMAKSLRIHISALSDIHIQTYEDILRILFLLEELFHIDIKKQQKQIYLIFDLQTIPNILANYLVSWEREKRKHMNAYPRYHSNTEKEYEIWKSRFPDSDLSEMSEEYLPFVPMTFCAPPLNKKRGTETSNQIFGRKLKWLRLQIFCKSPNDFAQNLGIDTDTLFQYEHGLRTPTPEFVNTVTRKCNCSHEWLLGIENTQQNI